MAPPEPSLRFHFDFVSSNAYLAWATLARIRERFGARVEPVPTLFAGLLEAHGQLGPAEVPPKAHWMWKSCLRKAAALGIPLRPPAYHPFNPLLPLRVCSLPMEPRERDALVGGLFRAIWAEGAHGSDPSVVERVADAAGLEGARLVAEAGAPEAKERLRAQTDAAIRAGVFGVPTVEVAGEIFWGYDDLPWLERHLAGDDPIAAELPALRRESAFAPSASATRRRGPEPAG